MIKISFYSGGYTHTHANKDILTNKRFLGAELLYDLVCPYCLLHRICPIKSNYFVLALKKTYYWHKNKFKFTYSVHSRIHIISDGQNKEKAGFKKLRNDQLIELGVERRGDGRMG